MSFDLFLQRFERGDSAEVDRTALLTVLRKFNQETENRFGIYLVEFPDGSHVEFSAKGLETGSSFTGCAFHLRGMSSSVLSFVYDVAASGDMVIFNPQGSDQSPRPTTILTNERQATHLPASVVNNPALCDSSTQLAQLLGISFADWEAYRDQVIGRHAAES